VFLLSVTSSEPDEGLGDGDFPDDIQGEVIGTDDRHFQVRRERTAQGPARVYTVTYFVQDAAGNGTVVSAVVVVVKSQGEGEGLLNQIGDPSHYGLGLIHAYPTLINDPPFNLSQHVSDSIAVVGEVDIWTVDLVAGQRVFFDAQVGSSNTFRWTWADPDDVIVFSDIFQGPRHDDCGQDRHVRSDG
jgi:hypothetical protein